MPETTNGIRAINAYLEKNGKSWNSLATVYGKKRQWVGRVLSGKDKGKAANDFILTVIDDYKIR